MTDERFKALLSFLQFFLGTVVVGIVSTLISHQIQTREIEIKEQESNARFLEQALQEDVGVRRRLAQYFSHVTRSDELRERWKEYAQIVEAEYQQTWQEKQDLQKQVETRSLDATERDRLLARVAQLEMELSPRPTAMAVTQPRVYIHIANQDQRKMADQIAAVLREGAVIVPGVEIQRNSPLKSELRYFRQVDLAQAESIAATIQSINPDVSARYIPGYENSTGIRPGHFELWLAANR